jgi:hypothetical protein
MAMNLMIVKLVLDNAGQVRQQVRQKFFPEKWKKKVVMPICVILR